MFEFSPKVKVVMLTIAALLCTLAGAGLQTLCPQGACPCKDPACTCPCRVDADGTAGSRQSAVGSRQSATDNGR